MIWSRLKPGEISLLRRLNHCYGISLNLQHYTLRGENMRSDVTVGFFQAHRIQIVFVMQFPDLKANK